MSYVLTTEIKTTSNLLNDDEKVANLRIVYRHSHLFLPENFYNQARSAHDLEAMLERLAKHIGLRTLPRVCFSNLIKNSGLLEVNQKQQRIMVNARFTANPYACAAIIAHNLCHYSVLIKHKIMFDDASENEKTADLATIYSGLGIIVINGLLPLGWRGYITRLSLGIFGHQRKELRILGYYRPKHYMNDFKHYLVAEHTNPNDIAVHALPWIIQNLVTRSSMNNSSSLPFVREAQRLHNRSLRRFWISLAFVITLILIGWIGFERKPAFLSEELAVQRSKMGVILDSYEGCAERVSNVRQDFDQTEPSVARYIDGQITKCKSLENRYNHEVDIYNAMLKNYDR